MAACRNSVRSDPADRRPLAYCSLARTASARLSRVMRESEASNASYVVGCNAELAARVIISTGRSLLTDGAATRRGYLISSMKSENGGTPGHGSKRTSRVEATESFEIQSLFLHNFRDFKGAFSCNFIRHCVFALVFNKPILRNVAVREQRR